VETGDGQQIALHHYAPVKDAGHLPVMMLHGLGSNRHNFDLFGHIDALPRQMARDGYQVYVVELRGVGVSRQRRAEGRLQGVDAYLRHDLPAAVAYIRRVHDAQKLHWVGHSMGAMLGYLYGSAFPEHLQSLLAAAGPAPAHVKVPARSLILPFRHIIHGRRMGDTEIPNRLGLHAIKRMPRLIRLAYDKILFSSENMTSELLVQFAQHGLENVPLSVIRRIGEWAAPSGAHSGEIERALSTLHVPTLMLAARYDPLCPPEVMLEASKLMPYGNVETCVVSREQGFKADFGHGDLLASHAAVREVYPLILRFIADHETRRTLPKSMS